MNDKVVIFFLFILISNNIIITNLELPLSISNSQFIKSHPIIRNLSDKIVTDAFLTQSQSKRILIDVCLGIPSQCFKMKISTTYGISWITHNDLDENGFIPEQSSTFIPLQIKEKLQDKSDNIIGTLSTDTIKINQMTIDNFPFILSETENGDSTEYTGALSLAYQYQNYDYSFIHTLLNEDIISKEKFYIKFDKKISKGYIYFGEAKLIERNINKKKYRFKKCALIPMKNISDLNDRWECVLNGIYFYNANGVKFVFLNDRISFNLSENLFLVTESFFDVFRDEYMRKYIDEGECQEINNRDYRVIECSSNFFPNKLGSLNYIIEKYTIKFYGRDLFTKIGNKYYSVIASNKDKEFFLLGFEFFAKFVVEFNKDNSYVGWIKNNF